MQAPHLGDAASAVQEEEGGPEGRYAGMACSGCGPAELMDLYMAADRLGEAVSVVEAHVDR